MVVSAGIPRAYGRLPTPFDPRDQHLIIPRHLTRNLSASVDLSGGMGPLLNQGAEGSCGPNTADEIIAYLQKRQGLPVLGGARQFIYYQTRVLMGTVSQDSGVDNRSMLQALTQYGFPTEDLDPYDDSQATMVRPPSAALLAAALPNAIASYSAVVQNLTQIQSVMDTTSLPILFGTDVFAGIESQQAATTGIVVDPTSRESPVGGHDITLCGYNATSGNLPGIVRGNAWPPGTFRFRNHWENSPGQPWGDGGYGYFSFGFVTNAGYNGDFWVVPKIPGAAPTPPVPPVPAPGIVDIGAGQTLRVAVGAHLNMGGGEYACVAD